MPLLVAEFGERWRDESLRRAWCEMVLEEAAGLLAREPWTIEHPRDWSGDDTAWLERACKARGLPLPVLREHAGISAGLRVRLASACLDATVDGLMADIHAVEGRLLAAWERQVPEHREAANG